MFNSKIAVSALFLSLTATTALAADEHSCYELSRDGQAWSRTPEILCVDSSATATDGYVISLKTGLPGIDQRTVAKYNFDLLQRARCMDCNADVFGLANPSNSIFNGLQIKFDGKRVFAPTGMSEQGTVVLGTTQFHYRSY